MKKITLLILGLLFTVFVFAQGHFVLAYSGYGQDHMNIYVVSATIGGIALEAGDEIAAFDGTICCGKATLSAPIVSTDNSTYAAIAASKKDDGLSNGYTAGNAITYKFWDSSKGKEISGITAEYFDPGTGNPITTPTYTANGSTIVKLSATAPTNQTPVSNAGADQSVNEGDNVTLDGSASSDPDNNPLTYLWTAPASIILSSNTAAKPTFTAPEVTTDTKYTLSLVVNDGTVNSTADQVEITVKQVNKAPVANAGPDQTVNEATTVTLDGSASSDPDSNPLTYLWTAPAGIILSSNTATKPTFTAPEVTIDTKYTLSLVVNDGTVNSTADQVEITVKQVNKAPVANAGTDQTVNEAITVTLDGSASSDPDNNPLTYLWTAPAGITLSSNTAAKPTFTAPDVNSNTNYTFTLVVNDGFVDSPADQIIITIKQENSAPFANAGTDQSVNEETTVTLDGSASSDPDNNPLTYLWTAPAGIILSSNTAAKPTFTAPEVTIDTKYTLSLVVNDGTVNSTADQVEITVKQVNKAPVANAGTDQTVNEASTVTLDGSASSDPDSNPLTYLWAAPAGITLSSNTAAKPTFTAPEVTTDTKYTLSLVVNDGTINSTADQVEITVKQVNKAPVAHAGPDQTVNEALTVTLDGSASSDPDNNPLTYLWTAPAGITLSSNTAAKPTFTAPEVTTDTKYTLSLVVNDGTVNSTADQVEITVKQVNKAPVYTSSKSFTAKEDEPFELNLQGTDVDNDPISFSISDLPSFLKLASKTSTSAVLSGTFTNKYVGNNTFNLTLSDGSLSISETITISVTNVDDAPYVKDSIKNVSVDKRAPDQTIDLKTVFADDDAGDILTYTVSTNTNDKVVTAKITGSSLTLSFSAENSGTSELIITAGSNGKEAKSKFKVEVKIPTGISPVLNEPSVLVYPNPTKGKLYVKFDRAPQTGTSITVYNLTGKEILKMPVGNLEETINLEEKPNGFYFIRIDQKTPKTYKIILE